MQTDPPATTEPELPDDKALLALRQKFKRTATNLTKVDSHRQFLADCLQNDRIPKGLQVGTKCNALLADYTDVQQRFKETTNRTQRELTSLLVDHYEQTYLRLSREKAEIQEAMDARLPQVSPEQRERHTVMMTKTLDNVMREREKLTERKKRKLSNLEEPNPQRQKKRRGQDLSTSAASSSTTNRTRRERERETHKKKERRPRREELPPTQAPPSGSQHPPPMMAPPMDPGRILMGLLSSLVQQGYVPPLTPHRVPPPAPLPYCTPGYPQQPPLWAQGVQQEQQPPLPPLNTQVFRHTGK